MDNFDEIIAIECDECQGAGFLFYENENSVKLMPCDCIPADEDFAEMIMGY